IAHVGKIEQRNLRPKKPSAVRIGILPEPNQVSIVDDVQIIRKARDLQLPCERWVCGIAEIDCEKWIPDLSQGIFGAKGDDESAVADEADCVELLPGCDVLYLSDRP